MATLSELREKGYLTLQVAAALTGTTVRNMERRRHEGTLQVERFTLGRQTRVFTKREWIAEAGMETREPRYGFATELLADNRSDPLERVIAELGAENARLRLRVAQLEHQLAERN